MALLALISMDVLLVMVAVEEVIITVDYVFLGGPCVC